MLNSTKIRCTPIITNTFHIARHTFATTVALSTFISRIGGIIYYESAEIEKMMISHLFRTAAIKNEKYEIFLPVWRKELILSPAAYSCVKIGDRDGMVNFIL